MLFSIGIPVYNAKQYLRDSVNSVLSQSFQDYEIILVDDGSTDGSAELCEQLAKEHPDKIRVIHNHENKGLLLSRRVFFQNAVGEWFLAVDADDRLMEGALERISLAIAEYHCDLILYDLECVRLNGSVEEFTVPLNENHLYCGNEKKKVYEQILENNYINSMCTKAIKRSTVDMDVDYHAWKELQIGEDLFQTYPIIDKAESILYVKKPLYRYIKREGSLTNKKNDNWYIQKKILWERDDDYINRWNLGQACRQKRIQGRLKSFVVYLDQLFLDNNETVDRLGILKTIREDGKIENWFSLPDIKKCLKLRYRLYYYAFTHGRFVFLGFLVRINHRFKLMFAR